MYKIVISVFFDLFLLYLYLNGITTEKNNCSFLACLLRYHFLKSWFYQIQ